MIFIRSAALVAISVATAHAQPVPDSIAVQLADPKPPANVAVTLVGYAADDKVSIAKLPTDARGTATFTGLDTSGAVAYFALAQLPRQARADRLSSGVLRSGIRVTLAVEPEPTVVAAGKVRVEVKGLPDPAAAIEVIDAATGKLVAGAVAKPGETHAILDVKATPGQVVYARTTARKETYRSPPIQVLADRGSAIAIMAYPRNLQRFEISAQRDGDWLAARLKLRIENNSWIPYAPKGGIAIPLPVGFKGAVIADASTALAKLTATGLLVPAPLPPGGLELVVGVSLPVAAGKVRWALELPAGTFQSRMTIAADPGMTLAVPAGVRYETKTISNTSYFVFADITVKPKRTFEFTVAMPALSKAQSACARLSADRGSPLRDQPMPSFTATQLDGTKLVLSSLRGKLLIVNFTASWSGVSDDVELAKLAAAKLGEIVMVSSDKSAGAVTKRIGAKPPYRVVLDPPAVEAELGPITKAWGVEKVPETFLIDRAGKVRFYFQSTRDWSSTEAIACLTALAAE